MKKQIKPTCPKQKRWLVSIVALVIVAVCITANAMTSKPAVVARPAFIAGPGGNLETSTISPSKTPVAATTECSANSLSQNIIVSISKRHLWACADKTVGYDSAVVTGMENLAADLTPTGTYHIYSKQTDLSLKGSDSTGSWDDPVSYWMPFLDNQYGEYGFHDATWRAATDFGNIDPYSSNGSHGCVELPLATATWLYSWASVGTTVTIES